MGGNCVGLMDLGLLLVDFGYGIVVLWFGLTFGVFSFDIVPRS